MCEHERYEHGVGPIYSVPLIDTLPLNPSKPGGMLQQMASREELQLVVDRVGERVAAAYEILLHYWRIQHGEIGESERLKRVMEAVASMPGKDWLVCQLALAEALDASLGTEHLDYVMRVHEEATKIKRAMEE